MGNKRRLLNVNDIVSSKGSELCDILLAFHSFTGCDTISAFVRCDKVAPLKVLEKRGQFLSTFRRLGQNIEIQDTTSDELEQFVCCIGGKLRYDLFMQKYQPKPGNLLTNVDGIDLNLHVRRVNYQAMVWNSH